MTIRQRVIHVLLDSSTPRTASDIYHVLNNSGYVKLSSLSGILKRMYDAGELRRVDEYGPRGGYGYLVNHS